MCAASAFTITFGANCGSISTMSAPVARILLRPSRIAAPWSLNMWSRMTELVPSCHRTRSGLAATSALSKRLSMSATSSPFAPRLSTVIELYGNCFLSSTASWLGYDLAGELAPAPAVDDEPIATMVIGAPAASFCATCDSGLASLSRWSGASHMGAAVSACAENGNNNERGDCDRFYRPKDEINIWHHSFLHPDLMAAF